MIPILLHSHTRSLTKIIYNRQGDLLFSASKDSSPNVWFAHNGERLGSFEGHEGVVWTLAVTEDSQRLVTGSGDSTFRVWSVETGRQLFKGETETAVRWVALSQGDKMVAVLTDATMGKTAKILIYDMTASSVSSSSNYSLIRSIDCGGDSKTKPTVLAWSDCNEFLIVGHHDGTLSHWDWQNTKDTTSAMIKSFKGHDDVIRDLQLSPDRSYFITASRDTTSKLFDTASLTPLKVYKTDRPVNAAAISPLRNEVVIAGGQEALHVTTTSSRAGQFEARFFHQIYENELGRVRGHFGPINTLAYHPSGKGYASGGEDGYVRIHHFDNDYFDFNKDEPVFL